MGASLILSEAGDLDEQRAESVPPGGGAAGEPDARIADDLLQSARSAPTGLIVADASGRILFVNDRTARMLEREVAAIREMNLWRLLGTRPALPARVEVGLATGTGRPVWLVASLGSAGDDVVARISDITVTRAETMLHREVIGAMARNAPIEAVMEAVCRSVQKVVPHVVATVLALNDDGTVRPLAAPAMPQSVAAAFAGLPIGPAAGSCGTAMYRGERVVVTDIASDPLWEGYRDAVLPHGLRACWSTPIMSRDRQVLGAFAFYDREPRGPDETHLRLIDLCVDLCALALERELTARWMHQLTVFDRLTGLPNRQTVHEAGEREVVHASGAGAPLAALFLDIDRFKEVNDAVGRSGGDDLLRATAARLRGAMREGDLLGRVGGDEFVAILPGSGSTEAADLARRLVDEVGRPVEVAGTSIAATMSVGVSEHPAHGGDIDTLVHNAELAMRHAKRAAHGSIRIFHPDMNSESARRRAIERALRGAVAGGGFVLHYQPQTWMHEPGGLYGLESLIRLHDEELGLLAPDTFLGVAEECHLMGELNRYVLDEGLAQLARWTAQDVSVPQLAVNMSASSFRDPTLAGQVDAALMRHGLAPGRVMIEMTERVMLDESDRARANFDALHEMGVRLSLDDFGTGYSSLSYLHRLRVDELKLDKSFVQQINGHSAANTLISSILGIAENLNLTVVAEGVEEPRQRDFLVERRCDVLQGYLVARPLPAAELDEWLVAQAAA